MRIALIQMAIVPGRRSANLVRALGWIDKACDLDPGPDLVVLPECCDIGWLVPGAVDLAEPVGGPFAESLAAKAREMGVHLVAGLTERDGEALYSAGVLFDVDGDVLLRQRKINLQASDNAYAPGDRLRARQTAWGRVGIEVSTDLLEGCITDALAAMGARVILSPCAWGCKPGGESDGLQAVQGHLAERTAAAPVHLVSVNGVGEIDEGAWQGMALFGGSMAYGPGGEALLVGPTNEEALLTVDIETGT